MCNNRNLSAVADGLAEMICRKLCCRCVISRTCRGDQITLDTGIRDDDWNLAVGSLFHLCLSRLLVNDAKDQRVRIFRNDRVDDIDLRVGVTFIFRAFKCHINFVVSGVAKRGVQIVKCLLRTGFYGFPKTGT